MAGSLEERIFYNLILFWAFWVVPQSYSGTRSIGNYLFSDQVICLIIWDINIIIFFYLFTLFLENLQLDKNNRVVIRYMLDRSLAVDGIKKEKHIVHKNNKIKFVKQLYHVQKKKNITMALNKSIYIYIQVYLFTTELN